MNTNRNGISTPQTSSIADNDTSVTEKIPSVIVGRVSKYAFVLVDNEKSGLVRAKMNEALVLLEEEGFLFQRIPTSSDINEGYGLLKSIIEEDRSLFKNSPEEDRSLVKNSPEEVEHLCKSYQLWRFFTDNSVEEDVWSDKLYHLLGEINQLRK